MLKLWEVKRERDFNLKVERGDNLRFICLVLLLFIELVLWKLDLIIIVIKGFNYIIFFFIN